MSLGLAAAIAEWLEDVGPRCVGVTAATLWEVVLLLEVLVFILINYG